MDDASSGEIPLVPLDGDEDAPPPPPPRPSAAPEPRGAATRPESPAPSLDADEDESEELAPPPRSASGANPGYLPRLRTYEAEPAPEAPADPKAKPSKEKAPRSSRDARPETAKTAKPIDRGDQPLGARNKGASQAAEAKGERRRKVEAGDAEKRGALIEQTPEMDTIESRRRVRLIVGGAIGLVALLLVVVVWRSLSSGGPTEEAADTPAPPPMVVGPAQPDPNAGARDEAEARMSYEDAHNFARRKDVKNAVRLLESIVKNHPKAATAALAAEALDRPKKNLPLFLDVPAVLAHEAPEAKPEPPKAPEVVVEAPRPAVSAGPVEAYATPPPTPPEPVRDTGLAREDAKVAAKPLPVGFRPRPGVGVDASGWPIEITCDKDGAAMVLVPGGDCVLGRDDGPINERPAHTARMPPFYVDQHETTVRQYRLYLVAAGKKPPKSLDGLDDDLPVTGVSARDARAYNQWAGKSLPSEAQWETAARATDARLHPWGNAPASWPSPRTPQRIDPVMSFPGDLSPYGVYDLAGNAWEWTNDYFDPQYYQALKGSVAVNPGGPSQSKGRPPQVTIKGGSKDWTATFRDGRAVETHQPHLGFRGVLGTEATTATPPAGGPGVGPAPAGGGKAGAAVPF